MVKVLQVKSLSLSFVLFSCFFFIWIFKIIYLCLYFLIKIKQKNFYVFGISIFFWNFLCFIYFLCFFFPHLSQSHAHTHTYIHTCIHTQYTSPFISLMFIKHTKQTNSCNNVSV